MNKKLTEKLKKFDELPIRSRILFTFTAMVFVGFIADLLFISPSLNKAKQLINEISLIDKNIEELINSQAELNSSVRKARSNPLIAKIAKIDNQLNEIKDQLAAKTISLVKPELMSQVLHEIIQRSKSLQLLSLTKKPPIALFDKDDNNEKNNSNNSTNQQVTIYRHLVEMALEGKYTDTVKFLEQLEKMPKQIGFESFQYQVEKYPISKIKLIVSTLSFERKWIGG